MHKWVVAVCLLLLLAGVGCASGSVEKEAPAIWNFTSSAADPAFSWLFDIQVSPDGERVSFIRHRTPEAPFDPTLQLWIADRDGSNPQIVSVNTGSAVWSPDGIHLAVTVVYGIDTFVSTIDIATRTTKQWTGHDSTRLNEPVVSSPSWFLDGKRLLVSAYAKAFGQTFDRGLYVIDTATKTTTGPLVELFEGVRLGGRDRYALGRKYLDPQEDDDRPNDGNLAVYDLQRGVWDWLTHQTLDAIDAGATRGGWDVHPTSDALLYTLKEESGPQVYLQHAEAVLEEGIADKGERLTHVTGFAPTFMPSGEAFVFLRDVDPGPLGRYVPFYYDLARREERPLWPTLPDSLPVLFTLNP